MPDEVQISYTEEARAFLDELKKIGIFKEMQDGFRFAMGLAIARGKVSQGDLKLRTFLGASGFDPDGSIRGLISELYPEAGDKPYAFAERLAEAGIQDMKALYDAGQLRLGELMREIDPPAEEADR